MSEGNRRREIWVGRVEVAGLRSICVDPALVVGSNFRWEMVLGRDFDAAKEFARSFSGLRAAVYQQTRHLKTGGGR